MAPISLQTVGELASQLTQEFGDRDSQILRLEAENARLRELEVENARLRELEVENARSREVEGENARLRALLEAAAAARIPSCTTPATLGVQSQSRAVTSEDRQQSEDSLLDEACDVTEADGGRSPALPGVPSGRVNHNRSMGNSFHRNNLSSDDDEDPIPVRKPKKEKVPVTATAGANKRKRAAESSSASARLSESLDGLVVDESNATSQRQPTFVHPASQENDTWPAKSARLGNGAASKRRRRPVRPPKTPAKQHAHPPHAYTPLEKSPFQKTTLPPPPSRKQQQSSKFRYPGSKTNDNITKPSQPKWPKQKKQSQPSNPAAKRASTYAEITPFTFKFVHSYTTCPNSSEEDEPDILVFDSASLKDTMSSFWKTLTSLRDKWEDQAGAEWAWEVQKKVKTRGRARGSGDFKRFCVTSKLDNRLTKWRREDTGFFACLDCAGAARPCFTWVRDEDGGAEDGDEVFGAPKGEFWCLPVHKDDRRCVDVKDREIRTWVNEGESSSDEDDDSGEESEESESGAVDEYDNDDSELTSGASSQESSEEDNGGEDSDGEL